MEWLQSAFQGQSPGLTLLAIVVGLAIALVLLFWIFRKIAGTNGPGGRARRAPRLKVVDALRIDGKRRLVLVRRDGYEHLVMIGGGSDVLLESHIETDVAAHDEYEAQDIREEQPGDDRLVPGAVAGGIVGANISRAEVAPDDYETQYPAKTAVQSADTGLDDIPVPEQLDEPPPVAQPTAETPAEPASTTDPVVPQYVPEEEQSTAAEEQASKPDAPSLEAALNAELEPSPTPTEQEGSVEPETREPATREPEKTRSRLSRDSDVEDEMQRLLDELSNN